VQSSAFKTILERLAADDDLASGWNAAGGPGVFEAMSASVAGNVDSKDVGNGNLSSSAMGAYADNTIAREARSVRPQTRLPISLAQLRTKLCADLSIGELRSLRRQFALDHHPDRLPAVERAAANSRLATANDLIDHAIKNFSDKSAA